jgi:hypothetical protein
MKTLASIMIALLVVTTINGAPQPSPANCCCGSNPRANAGYCNNDLGTVGDLGDNCSGYPNSDSCDYHGFAFDCICSSFIYSMIMQPSAHIGFRRKCKIEQNIFENYSFLM